MLKMKYAHREEFRLECQKKIFLHGKSTLNKGRVVVETQSNQLRSSIAYISLSLSLSDLADHAHDTCITRNET